MYFVAVVHVATLTANGGAWVSGAKCDRSGQGVGVWTPSHLFCAGLLALAIHQSRIATLHLHEHAIMPQATVVGWLDLVGCPVVE
jgi:hypothetical protein